MRLRILLAVLLPLALGACQTIGNIATGIGAVSGFSITQNQIDTAEATYGALLTFMVEYRCRYDNRPPGCVASNGVRIPQNACRAGETPSLANRFCAQRAIVIRLQETDKVVQDALDRVQADYASCTAGNSTSCSGLGAAYNTASAALSAATALARQYGFGG